MHPSITDIVHEQVGNETLYQLNFSKPNLCNETI